MGYDVIGDIHGTADKLEALLTALGYRHTAGAWRRADRTAIFVGDFIDRGPGQLRTLRIVHDMIDAGAARAVMGNHEFNAIAWATCDPDAAGQHLRPHNEKNRRQHMAFLAEVGEDTDEHRAWVRWFSDLPLWIEEAAFRVVHACWSPLHVAALAPHLAPGDRLRPEGILAASRKGSQAYAAIETLLKGVEVPLPEGYGFDDKEGHRRHEIRTRWWDEDATTYAQAYIGPPGVAIPDAPLGDGARIPSPDRPTFIGHYWFDPKGALAPVSAKVACVDYSAGKGGPLVAYRFDGEPELMPEKFVAAGWDQ